ncbi:hypothetical protein P8610_05635 [Fictibacillus sp. UD]|uniref:hypothetical protein n=1 Tax=Fictibacillus sp. UD TaxID=3038777 RepID=UPI003745ABFE
MDKPMQSHFENLNSPDRNVQYEAYNQIIAATEKPVDWAYEVWDQLKDDLDDPDNHKRSRAAQFLAHLAISDPEKKILNDFPAIWNVTYDKKFVTARHSLQSIWRIALAGNEQKEMVVNHLVDRFHACEEEKNFTLIRNDILQALRNLFNEIKEDDIKQTALNLIETVTDANYKKKYLAIWK